MKRIHMNLHSIAATQQLDEPKFKGLCINCENKDTCTFSKPKEGVLYCNEYE